MRVRASKS